MADETPRLRLVDPDERALEPVPDPPTSDDGDGDDSPRWAWTSAVLPMCIGIAILAVGLAVSLKLLMGDDGGDGPTDESSTPRSSSAPASSTTSIDPIRFLPTIAPTTAAPPTTVPTTVAAATPPTLPTAAPGLLPLPVVGGNTGTATVPPPPPATGTVGVRIFNGFRPGVPIEVWEVSGLEPVRYGTVPFAGLAQMVAGGQLLPSGVSLQLRFVLPGGDPRGARSASGPWEWNFTPEDGTTRTLMVSDNEGFRVLDIDNQRVRSVTPAGRVHVVPVVVHLRLDGTRSRRWAADGVGCIGVTTTNKIEFDLDVGTALKLSLATDAACDTTVVGPVTLSEAGPFAVFGLDLGNDQARLVAVSLA